MTNRDATTSSRKISVTAPLANVSPKTMIAAVLLSTMAILWGRVLLRGKGGPESVQAQEIVATQQVPVDAAPAVAMQFESVELACLTGRNDTLTADLFSKERWTAFNFNGGDTQKPVEIAVDGKAEEKMHLANLDALSKEMLLEAVIQAADGSGMQAFIGGKVLTVGQTLTVRRQSQVYDLLVTEISAREAVLTWKAYSIHLKLTESQEQ